MIQGDLRVPDFATIDALTELKGAEFTAYLTGSRFFGNAHEGSDWDFFVEEDVPGLKIWLEERGWEPLPESRSMAEDYRYSGDPNIAEVYEKGVVQLQLVRDLALKIEAQQLLLKNPHFLRATRHYSGRIFSRTYLKRISRDFWVQAMHQAALNLYEPPKDIEF